MMMEIRPNPATMATCLVALLLPATLAAQQAGGVPTPDYGPRTGYVNDRAGVVDPDSRNRMEDLASEVRRKSNGDIVVITLNNLNGVSPEEIAADLSELWNVGYRGAPDDSANDTGVLVILSIEDREFSIQVQEGARAFFPEAAIRTLVTNKAIEPFRAGNYGLGLAETVRGIAQAFAQHFAFELESND